MGKSGMGHGAEWKCQLSPCSSLVVLLQTAQSRLLRRRRPRNTVLLLSILSLLLPVPPGSAFNPHQPLDEREPEQNHQNHFTDQWAVHIMGGADRAHQIATKHGFVNTGEIFPDYYHFMHRKIAKRSVDPCTEYHERLSSEPDVRWHAQQTVKRRTKRDYLEIAKPFPENRATKWNRVPRTSHTVSFTDPRWPAMWYLNRGPGLDMNVQEAWEDGITGKGVVVTILDDGLEKDHPDIVRNYDPMASFDVNSLDTDPMPTYDLTDSNRHGTRCAGEVAAEANNSICAVGVAFEAGVGGIRMLDGDVTDAVEARSLSHNPQHIDIYSASWGPDDDGKTVDGPGELATRAFHEGITKGRGGKGSIFVWASGNGGRDHDNCNCDGYTNSIWTLSISSATENGLVPWYSEACSSTLATTYSSGGTGEKQIVTIDLHHSCTSSHTGTSASAPLAAGICALALQANTNLTWRDMQHIVVRTARPPNLIASDWATNGAGRNVSHSFGYGLMDAGAMVKLSRKWKTVPEQKRCEVRAPYSEKNIPAKSKVTLELKVSNCPGVRFLEHVQAKVTLTSGRRGDLQIYLISPSGTRSVLLAHRRHDLNRSGFTDWAFMSVHCWDENPLGKWILEIHNEGRYVGRTLLKRWSLVLYGTNENVNMEKSQETSERLHDPLSFARASNTSEADNRGPGINPLDFRGKDASTPAPVINTNIRKPARQKQLKGKLFSKKQKLTEESLNAHLYDSATTGQTFLASSEENSPAEPKGFAPEVEGNSSATSQSFYPTSTSESSFNGEGEDVPAKRLHHSSVQLNAEDEPETVLESQQEGKLKTWTLVAHGITENPNDKSAVLTEDQLRSQGLAVKPVDDSNDPLNLDFDGSENKIVVDSSHVHSPPLSANAPEVADMSSTLSVSGSCIRASISGKCLECGVGLILFRDDCLRNCPDNYFENISLSGKQMEIITQLPRGMCLPCHYSCKTCSGESENYCLTCRDDSTLHVSNSGTQSRCYSIQLLDSIESNHFWYKVLIIIFIMNAALVSILLLYVYCRRHGVGLRENWLERRTYSRVSSDDDSPLDKIDIRYSIPPSPSQMVPSLTAQAAAHGS